MNRRWGGKGGTTAKSGPSFSSTGRWPSSDGTPVRPESTGRVLLRRARSRAPASPAAAQQLAGMVDALVERCGCRACSTTRLTPSRVRNPRTGEAESPRPGHSRPACSQGRREFGCRGGGADAARRSRRPRSRRRLRLPGAAGSDPIAGLPPTRRASSASSPAPVSPAAWPSGCSPAPISTPLRRWPAPSPIEASVYARRRSPAVAGSVSAGAGWRRHHQHRGWVCCRLEPVANDPIETLAGP